MSLGKRVLRSIRDHLQRGSCVGACSCLEAIERELVPSKYRAVSRKAKRATQTEKNASTSEIRRAVFARANWQCEARPFAVEGMRCLERAEHLDHFFSRGRVPQSVENCWGLCSRCHLAKTDNRPGADFWLHAFIRHCERYGYAAEAERARSRLAFVDARGHL